MSLVIRIHQAGDADVLAVEDLPAAGAAPAGHVQVRQSAVGLDYVDVYHRTGLYPLPLPSGIGVAGAGTVANDGATLAAGTRVVYAGPPVGSYASARMMAEDRLMALPDAVPDDLAAGWILRGLTVHMLFTRVHRPQAGETLLVHAAAGGLGQILCRWAKRLGLTVIGTVGRAAKAEAARAAGADHVVVMAETDFVSAVLDLTGGAGADFAVDGIGGNVLPRTLEATAPFGTVASVGQAGGAVDTIPLAAIGPRRSLALSRPSVFAYVAETARYRAAAEEVIALMADGLFPPVSASYPLREAAQAHRDLEGRALTGAAILRP